MENKLDGRLNQQQKTVTLNKEAVDPTERRQKLHNESAEVTSQIVQHLLQSLSIMKQRMVSENEAIRKSNTSHQYLRESNSEGEAGMEIDEQNATAEQENDESEFLPLRTTPPSTVSRQRHLRQRIA